MSGALHNPWPFCHFESRSIHGTHVKERKNLYQIPKKNDPFQPKKKLRGSNVGFGTLFVAKNKKIVCKNQDRLDRTFALVLNDRSEVKSSDDAKKSPMHDLSEMGKKG